MLQAASGESSKNSVYFQVLSRLLLATLEVTQKNPTYRQVCSDKTGHAEAVKITFDPNKISYEDLLEFFFKIHDPTQIDRQGPDIGTQYKSYIFYNNDSQKEAAEKMVDKLESSGRFKKPIATQIVPASEFYKAEEYHQKYYEKRKKSLNNF